MKFYVKTKLSENISETPEGFLLCRNVPLTHTGVLEYAPGEHPFDEVKRPMKISRTSEELFSAQTMSSFEGKSITVEHPEDFVDTDNWQELSNGVMFNIRKASEQIEVDGELVDSLIGDFLITVKAAITAVKDGLREVSLGYDALWVQTGDDTAMHTNIRGNHCALVDSGRAGIQCAIKDNKGETSMTKELKAKFKKYFKMTVEDAVAEKEKESKTSDDKAEEIKAKLAEIAKLQAEVEAMKESSEDADEESEESKDEDDKSGKADKKVKKDESKDDEESEGASKVEERIARLEAAFEKLIKAFNDDSSEEVVEDADEDEESEESESEDSDDEGKESKVGDTMSRAEILAPGIKETKDVKMRALQAAYKTTDGKKAIKALIGEKKLSEVKDVDSVFVATSELLKKARTDQFATARAVTIDSFPSLQNKVGMTSEQLNKINAEHFGKK